MPSSWCNFYSEVFTYFGKVCVTHVKIIKMKIIQGQTSQNVKISIHRNQPESPYDHSIQCGHISMFLKKEDHFPESLLCITRRSLIALREIKQFANNGKGGPKNLLTPYPMNTVLEDGMRVRPD